MSALIFCFVTTSLHYFVGAQFIKAGIFTRIVAGLAFNAALIAFIVSFSAALARYAAILTLLSSFGASIYYVYSNKKAIFDKKINQKIVFKLIEVLLLYILLCGIYFSGLVASPTLFDGHQNYFSGVSLEILNSEYYSRLRIFDNYPVEWGKYHFFNGAITSLPQLILSERTLVTYMVAKICILIFLVSSIAELALKGLSPKKSLVLVTVCLAYIFTMLPHQAWWSVFTNAYSSLGFLILAFLCWKNDECKSAIFFALCFGLSTSRSLTPAVFLITGMIYLLYKNSTHPAGFLTGSKFPFILVKKSKPSFNFSDTNFILACVIIISAMGAMIFSGTSMRSPFFLGVENFLQVGWLSKMSPAITEADEGMRNSNLSFLKPSKLWHIFWVIVLVFCAIIQNSYRATIFLFFLFSFSAIYFSQHTIQIALLYYVYPMVLCVLLARQNLKFLVSVFILTSLIQIYVFNPEISVPNFAAIEWLVLFGFISSLNFTFEKYKKYAIFFCFGFLLTLYYEGIPLSPLNLFQLNRMENTTIQLPNTYLGINGPKDNHKIHCYSNSDDNAALAAAKGERVTYSANKSDRYSISIHFGMARESDLEFIQQLCK
jgi:hypothetical protein